MKETTVNIRQFWSFVRKRRGLIGIIFGSFVIITALINLLIPPTYQGELLLRIKQPKGLASSLLSDIGGSPIATKQLMSTYAEIMKSPIVVGQAIATINKGNNRLVENERFGLITTQPVRDTEILRVTVTASSPVKAMEWTNSLVDTFLARITTLAREEQSAVREFVGERLKEARTELERAESDLAAYKVAQKIAVPAEETKAIVERLSGATKMAAENEVAMAAAGGRLANARRQLGRQSPGFLADGPLIQQYKAKLAELELEHTRLRQLYTVKHPRITAIQAAIAETKQSLEREVGRILNAESPASNPIHVGVLQSQIQAEAELAAASAQRDALRRIMSEGETELSKLPAKEQGMGRVIRDALVAQEIYSMLAKRYEEARISEVMQPTDAQIINPAVEPSEPIRPRRTLNVAIAAILGLFCGLGAAFFLEYMNRTIRTTDDVKEYLGLPVLGSIPDFDSEMRPSAKGGEFGKVIERLRSLLGDTNGRLKHGAGHDRKGDK